MDGSKAGECKLLNSSQRNKSFLTAAGEINTKMSKTMLYKNSLLTA
jgi:hypothetical protein